MASGGVFGRPVVIDGRTAQDPGPATTTVVDVSDKLVAPYNNRRQYARRLTVHNVDHGGNVLLLYINSQPPIELHGGETFDIEAMVFRLAVQSNTGTTQYNIVATLAA